MRISADKHNDAYFPDAEFSAVFLNGERVLDCILADDERGCVVTLARDDIGNILINYDTAQPYVNMLQGAVKIKVGNEACPA